MRLGSVGPEADRVSPSPKSYATLRSHVRNLSSGLSSICTGS